MNVSFVETHKKALLVGLYKRTKSHVLFLSKKKNLLISGLLKKSDDNKIQKVRDNISKL